eukprot:m.94276 g.94276  ORF g.94276 m.94276 type:complete len:203 (-) comp13022_c0_seq2:106-714(-)
MDPNTAHPAHQHYVHQHLVQPHNPQQYQQYHQTHHQHPSDQRAYTHQHHQYRAYTHPRQKHKKTTVLSQNMVLWPTPNTETAHKFSHSPSSAFSVPGPRQTPLQSVQPIVPHSPFDYEHLFTQMHTIRSGGCVCHRPVGCGPLNCVQCSKCKAWVHVACQTSVQSDVSSSDFVCKLCQFQGNLFLFAPAPTTAFPSQSGASS